jgi:hypothetical protein
MALSVTALKNHLSNCTKPYLVHTEWSEIVEFEKLVELMAASHTTLAKPDIKACAELFMEQAVKLLAEGKYVKTPIGALYLCASGKFDSLDESFIPGEGENAHALSLHFRADRSAEEEIILKAEVERGARYDRLAPIIFASDSVKTDESMKAKAGEFIRVEGQRLRFDKTNETEGLFFVNGSEYRSVQYATITPSLLIAEVPAGISAGSYNLVVRSRQRGKDLHEGRYAEPFTIE